MSYATRRLGRLIGDAFRLALLRGVPAERLALGPAAILAIALATIVPPIAFSLWVVGRHGEWNWYALPFVLVHMPLLLGGAVGCAYAIGRPADGPRFFAAGLLISLVLDLAWLGANLAADGRPQYLRVIWALMPLPAAWLAIAMAVYASRSARRVGRRVLAAACCVVLVGIPLGTIYRDRTFWHAPYRPESAAIVQGLDIGPATESAFYRQPEVLARELDSVQPRRAGVVNVFLVAMAGYGREDVFMREVESVAELFRERFDAGGHVVRLVNNPTSILDTPIASRTSLRAALERVAQVMDRDEDVLVLFMTSHGSQDHRFALQLGQMQFEDLGPAMVKGLLDDAGIKNRVVIVSTCYSGGFVPSLAGPDTLVITAAAADRTSFGCGNEFDWTYFGDAFFNDALRKTHSFERAFEMARPAIEARERKEQFDPSNPQLSEGSRIAERLARLESRLDAEAVTAGATRSRATVAVRGAGPPGDSNARARYSPPPS
jgi:hypothetical protein